MRSTIVPLALASLAVASPAPKCKNFKQQNANFDDITGLPGVALQPIPTPYKGLYFQSFNLVDSATTDLPVPQVAPHSGTNYAGTGLQSELLAGTPMFTTNYPNSKVKSFSLESLYFGCVVTTSSETSVPSACDITITGYRGNDNSVSNAKQVCSRQLQYNPSTILGTQQQAFSGQIKGCDNIQFALIQYSPPGGSKAVGDAQSLLFDNIKYTTCSK